MKRVYIIIGCDTDHDRRSFIPGVGDKELSWVGMREGISRARECTAEIKDSEGNGPVFTWCLRVDNQIRHYYNDYAWVLKEHRQFLQELADSGDELGWHPHFWRFDREKGRWYQEIDDRRWQVEMLHQAYAAYREVFPGSPQSVRMGWNYHNTDTMNALAELGVRVDFSAVPGMKLGRTFAKQENIYNWYNTTRRPYYPSGHNYQAEGNENDALKILEVPNLVSRSFWWGMVAGLVLAKKMKAFRPFLQALLRPRYVINITAGKRYFKPILNQFRRDLRESQSEVFIFNSYFHADETAQNGSWLYSAEYLKTNLQDIVDVALKADARVKFISAREAASVHCP